MCSTGGTVGTVLFDPFLLDDVPACKAGRNGNDSVFNGNISAKGVEAFPGGKVAGEGDLSGGRI